MNFKVNLKFLKNNIKLNVGNTGFIKEYIENIVLFK